MSEREDPIRDPLPDDPSERRDWDLPPEVDPGRPEPAPGESHDPVPGPGEGLDEPGRSSG
jgi:hypothetical protein